MLHSTMAAADPHRYRERASCKPAAISVGGCDGDAGGQQKAVHRHEVIVTHKGLPGAETAAATAEPAGEDISTLALLSAACGDKGVDRLVKYCADEERSKLTSNS